MEIDLNLPPRVLNGEIVNLARQLSSLKSVDDSRREVYQSLLRSLSALKWRLRCCAFGEEEGLFELLYDQQVRGAYQTMLLTAKEQEQKKHNRRSSSKSFTKLITTPSRWFSSSSSSSSSSASNASSGASPRSRHDRTNAPAPSASSSSSIDAGTIRAVQEFIRDVFAVDDATYVNRLIHALTLGFEERMKTDAADGQQQQQLKLRLVLHAFALGPSAALFRQLFMRMLDVELESHSSSRAFFHAVRGGHALLPLCALDPSLASSSSSLFRASFFLRLFRHCLPVVQTAFEGVIHTLCESRIHVKTAAEDSELLLLDRESATPGQKDWLHNVTLLFCTFVDSVVKAIVELQYVWPREVYVYVQMVLRVCEKRWPGFAAERRFAVASLLYSSFLLPMLMHADALALLPNVAEHLTPAQTDTLRSVVQCINAMMLRSACGKVAVRGDWVSTARDDDANEDSSIPSLFAVSPDKKMIAKIYATRYWDAQMRRCFVHLDHVADVCARNNHVVDASADAVDAKSADANVADTPRLAVLSLMDVHSLYLVLTEASNADERDALSTAYGLLSSRLETLMEEEDPQESVLVTLDVLEKEERICPPSYLEWAEDRLKPALSASEFVVPLFELFSLVDDFSEHFSAQEESIRSGRIRMHTEHALESVLDRLESVILSALNRPVAPRGAVRVDGEVDIYGSWKGKQNMRVLIQKVQNKLMHVSQGGGDLCDVARGVIKDLTRVVTELEPMVDSYWRERVAIMQGHLAAHDAVSESRGFLRDHVAHLLRLKQSREFLGELTVSMNIVLALKMSTASGGVVASPAAKGGGKPAKFSCNDIASFIAEFRRHSQIFSNDEMLTSKVYNSFQRLCAQKVVEALRKRAAAEAVQHGLPVDTIAITEDVKQIRSILEARLGSALYSVLFNSLEFVSASAETLPIAICAINTTAVPMRTSCSLRPNRNLYCGLDRQFMRKALMASKWVTPLELELPTKNLPQRGRASLVRIFSPAIRILQDMSLLNNCSPAKKLRALKQCSQVVESVFAMRQSLLRPGVCDADTLLSGIVLVLLLLDSPITLPSTLAYIRTFGMSSEVSGADSYVLVTFELAQRYILEISEHTVAVVKREYSTSGVGELMTDTSLPVCRMVLSFLTPRELCVARLVCKTWQLLSDQSTLYWKFQHLGSSAAAVARLRTLSDVPRNPRARLQERGSVSSKLEQKRTGEEARQPRKAPLQSGKYKSMRLVAPLKQRFDFSDAKALTRLLEYSRGIHAEEAVTAFLLVREFQKKFSIMDMFAQVEMAKHIFLHYVQEGAEKEVFVPSQLRASLAQIIDVATAVDDNDLAQAEEIRRIQSAKEAKFSTRVTKMVFKAMNQISRKSSSSSSSSSSSGDAAMRKGATPLLHGLSAHTFDVLSAHLQSEIEFNIVPRFRVFESQQHVI